MTFVSVGCIQRSEYVKDWHCQAIKIQAVYDGLVSEEKTPLVLIRKGLKNVKQWYPTGATLSLSRVPPSKPSCSASCDHSASAASAASPHSAIKMSVCY